MLYVANLSIAAICVTIPSAFASARVYLYASHVIQIAQQVFGEVLSRGRLDALVERASWLYSLRIDIGGLRFFATHTMRDAVGNVLEELYRPLDANLIPSFVCLMPALLLVASFSVAVFGSLTMSSAAFFQIEGGWCVIVALS